MKVFKIDRPLLAFLFVKTKDGTNFDELKADVKAEDKHGKVELVGEEVVVITVNNKTITLPIGFAVVVGNGSNTVISADQFRNLYVPNDEVFDGDVYAGLVEKVAELENRLVALEPKKSAKAETKADHVDDVTK